MPYWDRMRTTTVSRKSSPHNRRRSRGSPMLASAKTLTYEEFMQLPDKAGKQELVEGDLIEVPPPTERHSRIAHRLFRLLDRHLQAGMEARMETGYRMGERTCLQPDLSILRSDQPAGKYREGAPVLA